MSRYILRRLFQAVLTVFGVMLITFILFRVVAGDVSTAYVNQKLGTEARQAFYEKHKLDRPAVINYHRRLELVDNTTGPRLPAASDSGMVRLAGQLGLRLAPLRAQRPAEASPEVMMIGHLVPALSPRTAIARMAVAPGGTTGKKKAPRNTVSAGQDSSRSSLSLSLSDGALLRLDVSGVKNCGDLISAINSHPENGGRLTARISSWSPSQLFDSQFFWHMFESLTFRGRSYATDQTLVQTTIERGRFSLAVTIPAMALGWLGAMIISCFVAYYRNTWIDHLGVFLTVLGMCVPYLAYMLMGQWIMFRISPELAAGVSHPASIYVPVFIMVIAGLGASVRFYRVILLDEIGKDYVRTARAKGVPLTGILFSHVLKNSMLPILTDVISALPFLIMGSLLLERFFGIPGLGDLMLTSISSRDVPIITGLTFLTSLLYVLSLLATDVLYAVFDPRIRLR